MKVKSYYNLFAGIVFLVGATIFFNNDDEAALWIIFFILGLTFVGQSLNFSKASKK